MRAFIKMILIVATLLLPSAAAAQQQALTLQQAVQIALEKNPLHKAAVADTKAAAADVRGARSILMPHLTFSEAATRGNDPVYVFGSRLRQQRLTAAGFALEQLNTPGPRGNFATRLAGSWRLFDSFASWHAVNRARQMNEASTRQLERADQEIVFLVVASYYGVRLAVKQVEVADQSVKTAQSILDRSEARFNSGLTVESDLLTARVRMAARQQELIRARNVLEVARAQLNTAMGMPADSPFRFAGDMAERSLSLPAVQEIENRALANRPDLKRIASEETAQRQSVAVARSSFGPRVNAFAAWEMDHPTFAAGGGGNNWMGGIEMQFDIFQGGAKRAELSRQQAIQERIVAMKQAASDAVRLEVRRAYYETDANRQQIDVARAAIAQAVESLRINQDRYNSGLTTMTDLLGAEDAVRRSLTDYWEAVYHFQTSYASLELASGNLNPQSPVVMP